MGTTITTPLVRTALGTRRARSTAQYLETEWLEYNRSRFNVTLNQTERFIELNGTYFAWEFGDDWKYRERCCPPSRRGSTTTGFQCHDLPEHGTCSEANQPGALPPQQNDDDEFVTGMFCGHTPIDPTIPDPNPVALLYDPLEQIRDGPQRGWAARVPIDQESASNAKHRRREWARTYNITRPSYWGQLQPAVRGSDHQEYAHTRLEGDLQQKGLIRKVTRVLLPGEPCCEAHGGNCHDWKCGGPGADWGIGWPTQGNVENGKCGNWGHNDAQLFARSDGSPNYMYNERCCPWTQRGSTTIGFPCHDLPEGATCSEANQCGSFPKQRPNEGDGDSNGFDGTDDLLVPGLFCGDSPMFNTDTGATPTTSTQSTTPRTQTSTRARTR